jgi:periplasmic protein TonB
MSYVSENSRSNFTGMTAAILVNGSIIIAVALSPLVVEPRKPGPITIGHNIPSDPPPPKVEPRDSQKAKPVTPIFVPKPVIGTIKPVPAPFDISDEPQDISSALDGMGGDDVTETIRDIVKLPDAPFRAAMRDPLHARHFQPEYPLIMLKREIEGTVTIRVLIGTDGRVRQAQILSASEPEFARATERQALKAWRFKPAMRGTDRVEDWQTLTVRFDIN